MRKILSFILYPISLIYAVLLNVDRKFTVPKELSQPVISVGNITWGGTGKTPIVIELLGLLNINNFKSTVLTRGYLRKSKIPTLLKNGALDISPDVSGDEPLLIARSVPNTTVIVGSDRYNNTLMFSNEIDQDVYILDDGFQHWKIKRDLDIVCINAANPFGNGMLIPSGILREPSKSLKRADIVVITNCDMVSKDNLNKLEDKLFKLSEKAPVLTCYGDFKYKAVDLESDFDINILKDKKVYSLSAIGFGKGFKNSIEKSGVTLKDSIMLRDHNQYNSYELNELLLQKEKDAYFIVTTKDAVKLQKIDGKIKEKIAVLTGRLQFIKGKEQWEQTILKCLQPS
ncbi:MAG: tetraacyldisaccharide 4'-kinase [Endomicrobium sp.]|jgi:tetraacyldisaccharide 4'-kinase|nr:tetraacyldisaccharide 4'-kinase [Endomicrobium sp.]